MKTSFEESTLFVVLIGAVALGAGYVSYRLGDLSLATAAAAVGVYELHLLSLLQVRKRLRRRCVVERLAGELGGTHPSDSVVNRRLAAGPLAIVEGVMEPDQVVEALLAQEESDRVAFGQYATEKGYLSEDERKHLVQAHKEGSFLVDQIRTARHKVEEYRRKLEA